MNRQLALKIRLPDLASFDNFYPGVNQEAVASVRELACNRPGVLFMHGAPGTGKSHLLYAAVKEAAARDRPALYASRVAAGPENSDWLELAGDGLVCLDDIGESLTGNEASALFSLYERMRNRSGSLLLSSRNPPSTIDWVLPDLRSRVRSDLVYHLSLFGEQDLEKALRLRAGQRGMHLSDEVVRFVLNRYERSPGTVFRLLDRIDTESLERKRRITVPFLKALESELQGRSLDKNDRG